MINSIIFWLAFCFCLAWMQGRIMPAVRRTPPGEEAQEQDTALHKWGTLAYFLPLLLAPSWLGLGLALATRLAEFDPVLNLAARRPAFEVGQTAATDKLLRRLAPNKPEVLSAALRLIGAAAAAAIGVAMYAK
jgi:hypothetical protein